MKSTREREREIKKALYRINGGAVMTSRERVRKKWEKKMKRN